MVSYGEWIDLADGVFYRRHESVNVNVGVVLGDDGALLIDTRAAPRQGRELAEALASLTSLPVRGVVNTHYHWDHTFGNQVFRGTVIWGHPECRRFLVEEGEGAKGAAVAWEPGLADGFADLEIVPPDHLVDPAATIDLGGRSVELEHPGRAHTNSDVVVRVADAPVVFAGDVLESDAPPAFDDGFPVAWAQSVKGIGRPGDESFVPGHGVAMTRDQVLAQIEEIEAVAAICRRAHVEGRAPEEVDLAGAPYPEETMRVAIARGLLELG